MFCSATQMDIFTNTAWVGNGILYFIKESVTVSIKVVINMENGYRKS